MIAIIIEAKSNSDFPANRIFQKISGSAVLHRVMKEALLAEHAHEVFVSMPVSDSHYISGSSLKKRVLSPKVSGIERMATFIYNDLPGNDLNRLHNVAISRNISDIVRISACDLFVPAWLINQAIIAYIKAGSSSFVHTDDFGYGLSIEVIPYWMLTEAKLYCESQDGLSAFLRYKFDGVALPNDGYNLIPEHPSLRFADLDQIQLFEPLLKELDAGADLGDLLRELGDEQEPV